MSASVAPAPGVECVECFKHGHHAKAVEYVDVLKDPGSESGETELVPMCVFHRDLDDCPGCKANDKDREELQKCHADRKQGHSKLVFNRKTKELEPIDPTPITKPETAMYGLKNDPLEGIDVDKALGLFKGGLSTLAVAAKMNVKAWRFQQSSQWRELTKGIVQPRVDKRERTENKARAKNPTVAKANVAITVLKEWKAEIEMKILELQNDLGAVDRLITRCS